MSIIDLISDLPTNSGNPYKTRDLDGVNAIIVHQTDGLDKGLDSVYSAAQYHVNSKGWGGIGYHFMVTDDGKIYQTNKLETRSYHAGGENTRSVGIAITGKHRYDPSKTNEEIIGKTKYNALVSSIVKVLRKLPNKDIEIVSHDDVNDTGKTDPNLNMDQLREDVKKKRSLVETDNSDNTDTDSDLSDVESRNIRIRTYLKTIHDLTGKIKKLL